MDKEIRQQSYVPLHVHTEFSLLDGALHLKDYVKHAKEQGWPALAITDHGNAFGAVKFFQQAAKVGIKPILGAEMYFIPDVKSPKSVEKKYYHLTILVQNDAGYRNFCRLMAFSYQDGFYFKPRIDFQALQENSEGLIVLSGCRGGLIIKEFLESGYDAGRAAAQKYLDICGKENFYLEVQPLYGDDPVDLEEQKKYTEFLFQVGEELGIELVATTDAHYLLPEHNLAHEVMLAVGTKNLLTDTNRFSFGGFKAYLKTEKEMLQAFPGREHVVWNSGKIADKCSFQFKFGELLFPNYEVPEGFSQESYFKHLCKEGLERIFSAGLAPIDQRDIYQKRLDVEVSLITTMGFVGYFLVVGDFVAWAKEQGIPVGPGRGSAAGSLVAWALQITNIDPVKYNLLFERFLNPERVSMPDMDIDFCIFGREEVINYVKNKYGHDSVCQIITFGTMAAKGVLKDVARVLGFSFSESQALTDLVPDQLKITLNEALEKEPMLVNMIQENPKIKELFDVCFVLEGVTRHASKHAAGVVISPQPLRDVIPLYIPPKTNELVTQYAMTELEAVGFLKMDFLGLKNLSVINQTVRAIEKLHGVKIDLDQLPVDDKATFELLSGGKTAGVFQFEGSGVTDVLTKLKPDKFEDLIAVNALYRPGPLGSGMVDDYIKGRHGEIEPTYLFQELRPVLEETYGVIVYQEQVMKVASVIAGYSLGGADILRRAMGKKKPEEMEKQKSVFLKGAVENGFDKKKAEKLFDLMAYFAGYGFNKSHSAAYALIAYQTAYLKAHYPKEFVAATLSFETSDPDKLQEYLQKTKEIGVKVHSPNINLSSVEFAAGEDGVLFGLSGIKNVGHACLEEIVQQRESGPFKSLFDFCKRINLRTANKRVLESLIFSGALDCLSGNRAQKIAKLDQVISLAQLEKEQARSGQIGIFSVKNAGGADFSQDVVFDEKVKEFELTLLLEKEQESLGFYLSSHPLQEYRPLIELIKKSGLSWDGRDEGGSKKCLVALSISVKVIMTKAGKKMAFWAVEDPDYKSVEVIVFPKLFEKLTVDLSSKGCFVIIGAFEKVGEGYKVKAEKIVPCFDFFNTSEVSLKLLFDLGGDFVEDEVQRLSEVFVPGGVEVSFLVRDNNRRVRISCQSKYGISMVELASFLQKGGDYPRLLLV